MPETGLTAFDEEESVQSFTKFVKALANLQKGRVQEKTDTTSTDSSSIIPKGTSIRRLLKTKKAITVKWKKQSAKIAGTRITGYQIKIATNKKFTRNKKTVTVKGYKKVSKRIRIPGAGKKFFIRIRTFKTTGGQKYYSPWSKTKTIKIKR